MVDSLFRSRTELKRRSVAESGDWAGYQEELPRTDYLSEFPKPGWKAIDIDILWMARYNHLSAWNRPCSEKSNKNSWYNSCDTIGVSEGENFLLTERGIRQTKKRWQRREVSDLEKSCYSLGLAVSSWRVAPCVRGAMFCFFVPSPEMVQIPCMPSVRCQYVICHIPVHMRDLRTPLPFPMTLNPSRKKWSEDLLSVVD